jgi:transcriptional regulator with XRE-family HTH domain
MVPHPLKLWRAKHRRTRRDVAEAVGVGVCAIYDIEVGRRFPRPATIARIVAYTGGAVTPNDFYTLPEPGPDPGRPSRDGVAA